ncbi:AAA family ATPase [Flavobacterium sp.]|uniref:AAA family ATPase n=1 Tax=Flavobacterium sp. TaxID=239 RepID=UPI004034803B
MIKEIEVKGLYEVFDHPIHLKEEDITLILGENGLGKTLILKMIKSFFDKNFNELHTYSYETFKLVFDDNTQIIISKSIKDDKTFLNFVYKESKKKNEKFSINIDDLNHTRRSRKGYQRTFYFDDLESRLSNYLPSHIERIDIDMWHDKFESELLSTSTLLQKYRKFLPTSLLEDLDNIPLWLSSKVDSLNVKIIETQRLLYRRKAQESEYESSVLKYSRELTEIIKNKTVAATDFASKLDRSYPNRIIRAITKESLVSDEELEISLKNLNQRRELLNRVGLLDTAEEDIVEVTNKFQDDFSSKELLKDVLHIYQIDSHEKLDIYEDIALKLDLLIKLINKRFLYKTLAIDKKKGFVFTSTITKKDIPLNGLSSGEQHELVLFYQLLFDLEPNTLLLIDEPEISLHISWQNQFINDLREIKRLNNFYAIIATHSPDIIDKNWDLTIQLKGV